MLRGLLPKTLNARAWDALGALKEQWGASIQALLFRARRLGTISDVTYRNAVITLTKRGWRRQEPGLVTALEQPSMLATAIDLLESAGISRDSLVDQARTPQDLFDVVVSRAPRVTEQESRALEASDGNVVSLFTGRNVGH